MLWNLLPSSFEFRRKSTNSRGRPESARTDTVASNDGLHELVTAYWSNIVAFRHRYLAEADQCRRTGLVSQELHARLHDDCHLKCAMHWNRFLSSIRGVYGDERVDSTIDRLYVV